MSGPIGFRSSIEHLWEELHRIDLLVRAQTQGWRLTIGASKPDHLWGMLHVTDAEVEAFLSIPFVPPDWLPPEVEDAAAPFWREAEEHRAQTDARLAETRPEVPLALRRLSEAFGLSEVERDVVLVCLLPELDVRYRRLYGYLQDDVSQTSPTAELLLQILRPVAPGATVRAVLDRGQLRAHDLVVVPNDRQDPRSLAVRPVRLDDRIVAHLLGNGVPDRRLAGILSDPAVPVGWDQVAAEPHQVANLQELAGLLKHGDGPAPLVFLSGAAGSGRRAAARAMCTTAARRLLIADVDAALAAEEPFERVVGLCFREAALADGAICWTSCDALLEAGEPARRWQHLVSAGESFTGPTVFTSARSLHPSGRPRERAWVQVNLPTPGYEQRRRLWDRCLPPVGVVADRAVLVDTLANTFQLTHGQMLDAMSGARASALQRDPADPRVTGHDVTEGCRQQPNGHALARRIEPLSGLTFDDLVLPGASLRQLAELRDRVRHHRLVHSGLGFARRRSLGNGLVAMFTGASGTGKTMAAELLAGEQGVDLYKIDLSQVVSKYVGETEKNLSQVFDDAERANAILFFDEADALFGKRGEVNDARDRWANIEVNHLLQRLEEFTGPVILASNLSQNIDDAFRRRIHVVVDFPFPDAAARLRIWQGTFPPGLQRPSDTELADVAERFALAGGSIRNTALDATFRAVAEANGAKAVVTRRHIVLAIGREYQKLGKPITKSEFVGELHTWIVEEMRPTRFGSPSHAVGMSGRIEAVSATPFGRLGSPETSQGS